MLRRPIQGKMPLCTTCLAAGCVRLRELTGNSILDRGRGDCYTHYNLTIHDPVLLEEEASFKKGRLPRVLY